MAFNVEYIYTIIDRFSAPLNKIARKTEAFRKKTDQAARGVRNLGKRASRAAEKFNTLAGAIAGYAIIAGFKKLIGQSVRVEDALADLVRVGNLTDAQLNRMETSMENLSEVLGKDKIGLLQQAFEGLKMGIPVDELEGFVELAARTAVAFDMIDSEAGRSLGSLRAKLGLNTSELNALMDSVNFVADNFAATGSKMVNIIERTSGSMASLNFPPEVIAGFAGFADQIETTQQLAASGLNQMFAKMKSNPKLVKEMMIDPIAALNKHFAKFAKMDPSVRYNAIEKQFGAEAGRFVEKFTNKMELFNKTMLAAGNDNATNSMLREMENRAARTSTLFGILGTVVTNTFEAIGDALKPATKALANVATKFTDWLKNFVKAHPAITQLVGGIALLVAVIALFSLAMAVLIPLVIALLTPVSLIVAGVMAAVGAFVYWIDSGNPLISMLGKMGDAVSSLFGDITELFGMGPQGGDFFDVMFWGLDKIGLALTAVLSPLVATMRLLAALFDIGAKLINLEGGAAVDAAVDAGKDIADIMGSGFDAVKSFWAGDDEPEKTEKGAAGGLKEVLQAGLNAPKPLTGFDEAAKNTATAKGMQKQAPVAVTSTVDVNLNAARGTNVGSANLLDNYLGNNLRMATQ
jgi:TP901 family phage tail tape measure protein